MYILCAYVGNDGLPSWGVPPLAGRKAHRFPTAHLPLENTEKALDVSRQNSSGHGSGLSGEARLELNSIHLGLSEKEPSVCSSEV